jgi:hypothetical protein
MQVELWEAQAAVGDVPHPGQPVPRLLREAEHAG